ncbi:MAG: hypothetical protein K2X46_03320, partial [Roseomonas sp.]|nr:hypothetical protein [Roseomonas sp.]
MKPAAATLLNAAAGAAVGPDAAADAAAGRDPTAEEVAAFLRDHPDFLAQRPDLYRNLVPPRRVHGENLADHMAAMVAAERARTAQ